MRFFRIYQVLAPFLLFPLGYALWLSRYQGSHAMAALVISVPIVFSYVIPALGMNGLDLWEFDTRYKIGKIRPQHGFLFGSATSLFGLLCLPWPWEGSPLLEALRSGVVLGSVIAFWNWLYDIVAIRVGFIRVYNRKFHEGQGPEAIATDYAPPLFGGFGFTYGIYVRACEELVVRQGRVDLAPWLWAVGTLAGLVVPVVLCVIQSLILHGDPGLTSYRTRGERAGEQSLGVEGDGG